MLKMSLRSFVNIKNVFTTRLENISLSIYNVSYLRASYLRKVTPRLLNRFKKIVQATDNNIFLLKI